jgi:hypothetical protein
MRASFVALVLLLASAAALAQADASPQARPAARIELEVRIRGLEAAIRRVDTEQHSLYQQFQMVQEMRRNERQALSNAMQGSPPPGPPPNYDDVVRQKQLRESRLQDHERELDRLYARYRELEEQKRQLLDQLAALVAQH